MKIASAETQFRTDGGNMIVIDKGSDFEFYSNTSKGAIQAYGYIFHAGK
jgi:rhamnogalacturonan hydrolase